MKKNLGVKNWIFPMPVLMIGTYNADGTPNMMNAAWGGITLEDQITICIDDTHKTWENIAARKAFTVAFGTVDTVKACDYLGIVSGNKVPDKVAKSLTAVKNTFVMHLSRKAPVVLEYELVSMNRSTTWSGDPQAVESALTDGKPDVAKMKPSASALSCLSTDGRKVATSSAEALNNKALSNAGTKAASHDYGLTV